jgi:hypothetical protein
LLQMPPPQCNILFRLSPSVYFLRTSVLTDLNGRGFSSSSSTQAAPSFQGAGFGQAGALGMRDSSSSSSTQAAPSFQGAGLATRAGDGAYDGGARLAAAWPALSWGKIAGKHSGDAACFICPLSCLTNIFRSLYSTFF